jgi:hypothetical protein
MMLMYTLCNPVVSCRFLEVEGSDVDARVDQDLGYVMDLKQRRITFSAGGACWALRFPSNDIYEYVVLQMLPKPTRFTSSNTHHWYLSCVTNAGPTAGPLLRS